MKYRQIITIIMAATLLLAACSSNSTSLPPEQVELTALALVNNLEAGDYDAATADLDLTMRGALLKSKLKGIWEALPEQTSAFKEICGTYTADKVNTRLPLLPVLLKNL